MNGWIEEEDRPRKMERREDEEDRRKSGNGEERRKWMWMPMTEWAEAEAGAEVEVAPIPPPPVPVDHEPEAEAATVGTGRLTRLFTNTQVWTGSSSSYTAIGHDPEDLTPSHIWIENRTRAAWRELDRATWHYHNLRVLKGPVTHNDPRDPYIAARDAATAPATDNDDPPTHEETSPSELEDLHCVSSS
ncbi:hypothetical protein Tco_0579183 [Tanacetum coccineum]